MSKRMLYWIATGILSAIMLFSVIAYFFQHAAVSETFTSLGYPTYLIYPLAVVKLLGVVAIVSRRIPLLKEWAYAGFFYNIVLAMMAHLAVGDGMIAFSAVAFVAWVVSYWLDKQGVLDA